MSGYIVKYGKIEIGPFSDRGRAEAAILAIIESDSPVLEDITILRRTGVEEAGSTPAAPRTPPVPIAPVGPWAWPPAPYHWWTSTTRDIKVTM